MTTMQRCMPLDQLRRALVALDSGHWPADLREWLSAGIRQALAGDRLDKALGLVPEWGKPSFQRRESIEARDAQIREWAKDAPDWESLNQTLAAHGYHFSARHVQRILNGGR